jgi:hypothetical protein
MVRKDSGCIPGRSQDLANLTAMQGGYGCIIVQFGLMLNAKPINPPGITKQIENAWKNR